MSNVPAAMKLWAVIAAVVLTFVSEPRHAQCFYNLDGDLMSKGSEQNGTTHAIEFARVPHEGKEPTVEREYRLTWKSVEESQTPFGRVIVLKGRLTWKAMASPDEHAVDWLQGIRVLVARDPHTTVDWSRGHGSADTAWTDVVPRPDGSFQAFLSPDLINRAVGHPEQFQVGASIGTSRGMRVEWNAASPVLPGSIQIFEISGTRPLSTALEMINAVSGVTGHEFNPAALIRAVNYLRTLGKDEAIKALEEYLEECADRSPCQLRWPRDPKNIDYGDPESTFLIVRLLFEPDDPATTLPRMMIGAPVPTQPEGLDLPLFPLAVESGIPFLLVSGYALAGHPEHPRKHLEWARKSGRLRSEAILPTGDPWEAAQALKKKLPGGPEGEQYEYLLRSQVFKALWDVSPAELRTVWNPWNDDWEAWARGMSDARMFTFDQAAGTFCYAH